jgi:hypothetical protein
MSKSVIQVTVFEIQFLDISSETGIRKEFALHPWAGDWGRFSGSDNGGELYEIPANYGLEVGEGGNRRITDPDGRPCSLSKTKTGQPCLISRGSYLAPLSRAANQSTQGA